jgi:uncharacterized integral membrane protein
MYNGTVNLTDFVDTHALSICAVLTIIVLVFIVFGAKNNASVQLALTKELVRLPGTTIDLWSVSHLILYMVFGLLMPDRHMSFLLAGATWEVVEDMLSSDETTQLADCKTLDSLPIHSPVLPACDCDILYDIALEGVIERNNGIFILTVSACVDRRRLVKGCRIDWYCVCLVVIRKARELPNVRSSRNFVNPFCFEYIPESI